MNIGNTRRSEIGDVYISAVQQCEYGMAIIVVQSIEDRDRFGGTNQLANVKRFQMVRNGDEVVYFETGKEWMITTNIGAYLGRLQNLALAQLLGTHRYHDLNQFNLSNLYISEELQ